MVFLFAALVLGGVLMTPATSGAAVKKNHHHHNHNHHANKKGHHLTKLSVALALDPPKMIFIDMYVAKYEGFFKKNGLSVKLEPELGGIQSARVVAAGDAYFDAGGTDAVAASAASGSGLTGVFNYGRDDLSLIATKSIKSVKTLRGKTIAIGNSTGPAYQLSAIALQQTHIPLKTVHFAVLAGGRPELITALASGKAQASVFHADTGITAVQTDKTLRILRPMYKDAPKYWYSTVAAPRKFVNSHPGATLKFVEAMVETNRWMYSHEKTVVKIGVKYTGETKPTVQKAYKFIASHNLWPRNVGTNKAAILYTEHVFLSSTTLKKIAPPKDVFDFKFIHEALKKLGKTKK